MLIWMRPGFGSDVHLDLDVGPRFGKIKLDEIRI